MAALPGQAESSWSAGEQTSAEGESSYQRPQYIQFRGSLIISLCVTRDAPLSYFINQPVKCAGWTERMKRKKRERKKPKEIEESLFLFFFDFFSFCRLNL